MPQDSLEDWEVALIKAMLERELANKTIQFYFNRPDRSVNSGRISEIKAGDRWQNITPATDHELDEFLDHHPSAQPLRSEHEPQLPEQRSAASQFSVEANGRLALLPNPLNDDFADEDVQIAYNELRSKAQRILQLGDNLLGAEKRDLEHFFDALAEPEEASIVRVWMRGNKLRANLRAHRASENSVDNHPAKLDAQHAELLSDLVDAFNVLAALAPSIAELDQSRLGPDAQNLARDALQEFSDLLPATENIASEEATSELAAEVEASQNVADGPESGRQDALTSGSIYNFLVSGIKGIYRWIRRTAGREVGDLWKHTKGAIYSASGLGALYYLWQFFSANYPTVASILEKITSNPIVKQLLDMIVTKIG